MEMRAGEALSGC